MKPNIAEIKKMLAAATPGPWYFFNARLYSDNAVTTSHDVSSGQLIAKTQHERDGHLIAKAPETIKSLIGEVEKQAEEIKRLRKVLEFYENEDNYHRKQKDAIFFYPAAIKDDMGQMAREELRKGEQTNG